MTPARSPPEPSPLARFAWGAAALSALAALSLQLTVTADAQGGLAPGLWRMLGFFTTMANGAVLVTGAAVALRPGRALARRIAQLAVTVAIVVTAIVYTVALRASASPQGLGILTGALLHEVTPALGTFAFAVTPGALHWRDGWHAVILPLGYSAYSFARGAITGWYPYWFLDAAELSIPALMANVTLLALAFLVLAGVLIALERLVAFVQGSLPVRARGG